MCVTVRHDTVCVTVTCVRHDTGCVCVACVCDCETRHRVCVRQDTRCVCETKGVYLILRALGLLTYESDEVSERVGPLWLVAVLHGRVMQALSLIHI